MQCTNGCRADEEEEEKKLPDNNGRLSGAEVTREMYTKVITNDLNTFISEYLWILTQKSKEMTCNKIFLNTQRCKK